MVTETAANEGNDDTPLGRGIKMVIDVINTLRVNIVNMSIMIKMNSKHLLCVTCTRYDQCC